MTTGLVKKLAEVMAAVERIPKRGRNDFHKYDYATEADIAATVRAELAARHVMLIPAIVGESRHSVGEKGSVLTVLEMEMEFLDGESGESIKKPWRGYGTDKEDKGGYKAMTGGEKYFLLKTFLMPTGDDPEREERGAKSVVALAKRIKLPDGTWQILDVAIDQYGNGTMTVVSHLGEEETYPIKDQPCAKLCEQIQQEGVPVVLMRVRGSRDGKVKVKTVTRWVPPPPDPEPTAPTEPPVTADQIPF